MDVGNGTSGNASEYCIPFYDMPNVMHYSLIPAVVIIATLAIIDRRKAKLGRLNCRPSIVVPTNFLDGYRNRWAYAVAFGATSNRLLSLLINTDAYWSKIDAPQWVHRTFLFILALLETSVCFYPLFACLTSQFKLVAAIFGTCYSVFWCTIQVINMFVCPENIDYNSFIVLTTKYSTLIYQWPSVFFLLIMVAKFLHMSWKCLRTGHFISKKSQNLAMAHHNIYVRCLLQNRLPTAIVGAEDEGFLATFTYKSVPGFLYPSRLLCVLTVTVSLSYQIIIAVTYSTIQFTNFVAEYAHYIPKNSTQADDFIQGSYAIIAVCMWVTAGLLILLLVGSLFLVFKNYRRHFLQLCRGEKGFIPPGDTSSPTSMARSMRWTGYQIAYLLWGMVIFFYTTLLICFALAEIIYAIIFWSKWDGVQQILLLIGPPILMNIIIFYSQVWWSRFFFLQPRPEPEQEVPLAFDNRKALETLNYFTFFANIAIGVFSTFFRLLLSLVVGLITLGRMDQSVLKKGYERLDRGHQAYLGMLFVDYTHNHPVLRVFCAQLMAAVGGPIREVSLESVGNGQGYGSCTRTLLAKGDISRTQTTVKQWHLAYTLLRNPCLIQHRKHNLDTKSCSNGSLNLSYRFV